jgi:hypothetical protein
MFDWREFNRMMDEMFNSSFNDTGWNKKSYKSPDGKMSYTFMSKGFNDEPTIDEVGNETILEGKGRHDACVVPRAVPIVEAMAAIVLLDFYLRNKSVHL